MSETIFNVEARTIGKHTSRALRRTRRVPAVVYGPKVKNINIYLNENEVVKFNKHQFENSIFILKSSDAQIDGLKVLKKSLDVHPVSRRPVHMDLFALDLTKTVRIFVELRFEGKSIGVKEGGILNAVKREVEVECLPTDIPQFLALDITNLGVGDSIHASELAMPNGVKLITLSTETLCTVSIVEEEKASAAVSATPDAAGAAPAAGAPAAAAGAGAGAAKADDKKK